ncbi:glycosyltransferase family 2 protein [Candidatus Pelagibacter sp.]|nr:glycosyltransferase family 2 protein [Candidatus Pelagibacter sp.]
MFKKISILIPVYNEANTIKECVENVLKSDSLNIEKEIIISDNNSNDGTIEILKNINYPNVKILFKDSNEGKGSNLKNALREATGDIIIFQDGDLEYSPKNYKDLLMPFIEYNADVVYGSRLTGAKATKIMGFPNFVANKLITLCANVLFNRIFSDIETGFKVFKKNVLDNLELKSDGFEIEVELTAKVSNDTKLEIFEVPITINSRRYSEGKKVKVTDFFIAIYSIFKWKISLFFK